MVDALNKTTRLQLLLDQLHGGDAKARVALIEWACERLRHLASSRLSRFPGVRRWEQTDDIMQGAMMRLYRALESVTPASIRDFLNLCGTMIRRELLDLVRHYYGPQGQGAHHATAAPTSDSSSPHADPAQTTYDPAVLAQWTEFHQRVETLPGEEREVFNLLWYQGLSQEEAAVTLECSVPTVKRRWRDARLHLGEVLRAAERN